MFLLACFLRVSLLSALGLTLVLPTFSHAAPAGYPWLNLQAEQPLLPPVLASVELQTRTGQPVSLAAGDFDEDGVPDLIVGYKTGRGGFGGGVSRQR